MCMIYNLRKSSDRRFPNKPKSFLNKNDKNVAQDLFSRAARNSSFTTKISVPHKRTFLSLVSSSSKQNTHTNKQHLLLQKTTLKKRSLALWQNVILVSCAFCLFKCACILNTRFLSQKKKKGQIFDWVTTKYVWMPSSPSASARPSKKKFVLLWEYKQKTIVLLFSLKNVVE